MNAFNLKKLVVKLLRETAEKIEAGTCDMTEDEAMELMEVLSHQAMSKEDACIYLNLGRSRFDDLVRDRKIPKGKKRRGHKELDWYKDELDAFRWKERNLKGKWL